MDLSDKNKLRRFVPLVAAILVAALAIVAFYEKGGLFSASRPQEISFFDEPVPSFVKRGKLTVLTRNAPTTYYEGRFGPQGFEYEMARAFAQYLGVPIEIRILDSVPAILMAMRQGQGDIAAAGIVRTAQREGIYSFGPGYLSVQQQVVARRNHQFPRTVEDLVGMNIMVLGDSVHHERLMAISDEFPELSWETAYDMSVEQLMEKVWRREIHATVADSNIVAINRRYYPELLVAFPLSASKQLAWVVRQGDDELMSALHAWFAGFEAKGELASLKEKYYGHAQVFDYVDIATFHRRIRNRLPLYRQHFETAARNHDLDWKLLAAMAYQESHWDTSAESPTGVRGVMMLTEDTATHLGIVDRLDPEQSIEGGARYFVELLERIPSTVERPQERIRFALAAYNVGMGHVWDARRLARELGRNPDSWDCIREVLPLLSQPDYYKDLPHGYARGTEPVLYVQRVMDYRDILEKRLALAASN
ncbi:MAG: membrane-bound lytic murein transglycosylase MltF [Desulfatibacillaceae bacterium]|nr:membrane-bound lytic murein transglycosylase MltF [Desulfatibacillaceae bacterium]